MAGLEPLVMGDAIVLGSHPEYHAAPDRVFYLLTAERGNVEWHELERTVRFCVAPAKNDRIILQPGKGSSLLEVFEDERMETRLGVLGGEQEMIVERPTCFIVATLPPHRTSSYMVHLLAYRSEKK